MPPFMVLIASIALVVLVGAHATLLSAAVRRACIATDADDTLPSVFAFAGVFWIPMLAFLLWRGLAPQAWSVPYLQRVALCGAAVTLIAAVAWTLILHRAVRSPELTRRVARLLFVAIPGALAAAGLAIAGSSLGPSSVPNQTLGMLAFIAMALTAGAWLGGAIHTLRSWAAKTERGLSNRCPDCGYDLAGLARKVTRCPECGAERRPARQRSS